MTERPPTEMMFMIDEDSIPSVPFLRDYQTGGKRYVYGNWYTIRGCGPLESIVERAEPGDRLAMGLNKWAIQGPVPSKDIWAKPILFYVHLRPVEAEA